MGKGFVSQRQKGLSSHEPGGKHRLGVETDRQRVGV